MSFQPSTARRLAAAGIALGLCVGAAVSAFAQTGPSPARQAIDARKAVFSLIGYNCRALADVVKGNAAFDAAEVSKQASRIATLADYAPDYFPDASNSGEPDTKAKADIWSNKADFAKKAKDFQDHAKAFAQVAATEKSNSDAFKAAFGTLAQDCKGCHESYKAK